MSGESDVPCSPTEFVDLKARFALCCIPGAICEQRALSQQQLVPGAQSSMFCLATRFACSGSQRMKATAEDRAACSSGSDVLVIPYHAIGSGFASTTRAFRPHVATTDLPVGVRVVHRRTELLVPPGRPDALESASPGTSPGMMRSDHLEHPYLKALTWTQWLAALETRADGDPS